MDSDRVDAESTVSGNQTNIPPYIRNELDIDDGDTLRWHVESGTVRITVVHQCRGTVSDFDGYDGEETTDVVEEHDAWGVS
ncbi:AbrB/MazE/SpoVT family DNA-binding domain-containing protein [Halorhabdus rudnickae]|uniref:AbrB/MazE/SpoVT family DNA-binding domain-containing protein n=1 Tax=Halorhabdus rudnickae TaxID=1775544 RepID=UPI001082BAF0|nr:AbrB/MazE/SpoVT family DNA-binding domain-containing protein [Halorhabdus rudnickae]